MLLRVSYQMLVYFLTSSDECLCTTWKNTNRRNCVLLCSDHSNAVDSRQCTVHERVTRSCYLSICSVLFFSSRRSEGWPHHGHDGRTFSIYLCPLLFWLTLPRGVLSTSWCCPSRPCVAFVACLHLALFLALSLSSGNSLFPHGVTIVC